MRNARHKLLAATVCRWDNQTPSGFLLKIWEGRMTNSQHLLPSSSLLSIGDVKFEQRPNDRNYPALNPRSRNCFLHVELGPIMAKCILQYRWSWTQKHTSCDLQHFSSLRSHGFFLEMHFLLSPVWGPAIEGVFLTSFWSGSYHIPVGIEGVLKQKGVGSFSFHVVSCSSRHPSVFLAHLGQPTCMPPSKKLAEDTWI